MSASRPVTALIARGRIGLEAAAVALRHAKCGGRGGRLAEGKRHEQRLLIGDLVLDVGVRQVSRGSVPVELPKLSFRLLHALALSAPDVLTQDELIERVWPGRVISPETLTQRVKLLRQALGDDAREPRYVGLVRGEGYRLLADVHLLPDVEQHPVRLLVDELIRRNVLGVALIYAAAAWALSRGFAALVDALPILPQWSAALFAGLLTVGFPAALWLAWRIGGSSSVRWAGSTGIEARLAAAASLVTLVGATAGLGWLIYPTMQPAFNTVAVMPFENLGRDVADEYFSEGVAGALRDQLGRVTTLQVSARTSSAALRNSGLSATAIADVLGVRNVVAGTFQRGDDGVRLTVEIIDGTTGIRIWNEQYTAAADDMLDVQQRLFDDVAGELAPEAEDELLASILPTRSESAYSRMLIANRYYQEVLDNPVVDEALLGVAIEGYAQAVSEDPSSALLHSLLGAALVYAGRLDEAEPAIRRALELDENLSHVQHTVGLYLFARREDGVGSHYERAVALNANNVEALEDYALYLWAQARTDEARAHLERALQIDRMSLGRYERLGNFYGTTGHYDEALALAAEIEERFDDPAAYLIVARIYELTGDLDEAIGWAGRALERDPDNLEAKWMLGELYARLGDTAMAVYYEPGPSAARLYFSRSYENTIDEAAEAWLVEGESPLLSLLLALAYNATGRYDTTIQLLEHQRAGERVRRDSHSTTDLEVALQLADALNAAGRHEDAVELAAPLMDRFARFREVIPENFHPNLNLACLYSIVDDDENALQQLERMIEKRGMPWYPRVRDQPCFRDKFEDNPRYQAVLDALLEQKRKLRDRLPATLERFRSGQVQAPAARRQNDHDSVRSNA